MEKKKLKLTISGSSKKTINNIELAKSHGKNSVVIEKKNTRFGAKSSFTKNTSQRNTFNKPKSNFIPKDPIISKPSSNNDFEKRKLAEQRATKRLKGESSQKGKKRTEKKSCLSYKDKIWFLFCITCFRKKFASQSSQKGKEKKF